MRKCSKRGEQASTTLLPGVGRGGGKGPHLLFYITSVSFSSFTRRIELHHLGNKEHLKAFITYHHSNSVAGGWDQRERESSVV